MEDNLILEGLLSMVTELKEKLEAQVTPASREETLERLGAIEQALSELHSKPAVPGYLPLSERNAGCVGFLP